MGAKWSITSHHQRQCQSDQSPATTIGRIFVLFLLFKLWNSSQKWSPIPLTSSCGRDHKSPHCWSSVSHQNPQLRRLCHPIRPSYASSGLCLNIQSESICWLKNYISKHHAVFLCHLQETQCTFKTPSRRLQRQFSPSSLLKVLSVQPSPRQGEMGKSWRSHRKDKTNSKEWEATKAGLCL